MQGFTERGGPPDFAQLQSTMQAIELACTSIQVPIIFHMKLIPIFVTQNSYARKGHKFAVKTIRKAFFFFF